MSHPPAPWPRGNITPEEAWSGNRQASRILLSGIRRAHPGCATQQARGQVVGPHGTRPVRLIRLVHRLPVASQNLETHAETPYSTKEARTSFEHVVIDHDDAETRGTDSETGDAKAGSASAQGL
jgi:hypothetical protein